ncbi:MAG: hypothetical protein DRH12_10155 [Deltaproteobacteria bacterium]|nr:MAG: hypothetical protein DRH12_10155 [Deltaproteobacteria bacterium]
MRTGCGTPVQHKTGTLLPLIVGIWVALGLFTLIGACGKKGDPFVPEKRLLASFRGVTARYESGKVTFTGDLVGVEKSQDLQRGKIKIRVDYAHYTSNEVPCINCPVDLSEHRITVASVGKDGRFAVGLPVSEQEGVYVFRLRVVGENGGLGPPSEILRLVIQ